MTDTERMLAACVRHAAGTPDADESAMLELADWLDAQGDHHDAKDVRAVASLDLWAHESDALAGMPNPSDGGPLWCAEIGKVASFRLTLGAKPPLFDRYLCGGWLLSVCALGTLDDPRDSAHIYRAQFPLHADMGDPRTVLAPYIRHAKLVVIARLIRCPLDRLLASCAKAALAA